MIRNIVIVNDFAHINGGAGKIAISTAIELAHKGYNVVLLSAVGPIDGILEQSGVKVLCLNQYDILHNPNRIKSALQGVWNFKAYRMISDLLSRLPVSETIVHIHAFSKALSPSILLPIAKQKYRVVYTLHDYFSFCPNGGLFNYQTQRLCQLKPQSFSCFICNCDSRCYLHKWFRNIRQFFIHYYFRKLTNLSVISIGKTNYNISYPSLAQFGKKWYMLQNPISLYSGEDPVDIIHNNFYLFIGRLSAEKGIGLFCQAMKELNLKGLVLGDGELRKEFEEKYPMVTFAGWVSGFQKEKLIRMGKCLIFPSLWYEGNPLTIVEIKSYGIPCIVPDKCAASEEIVDGENGYIFKSGDINSLKESIMKYENSDIKAMQNIILRELNPSKYSMECHIRNLLTIYNETMRM